jgi:hypothetical protein
MLDKLPAAARHIIIAAIGAGLTYLVSLITQGSQPLSWGSDTLVALFNTMTGAALTGSLLVLTPLVRQYGVGDPTAVSVPSAPVVAPSVPVVQDDGAPVMANVA